MLMYRSIVNTRTQENCINVILKTQQKTRTQLAKPNPEEIVNRKEKVVHHSFRPGDEVLVRDY